MNMMKLKQSAGEAANLMRSLASETRLMLLCQLAQGERSVGELCEALGISQANASQQLAVLRRERLVGTRRQGQTIFYSLAGRDGRRVIELLYEIYCGGTVSEKASKPPRKSPKRTTS